MNVQIAHVVSDLGGVTGMANLDAVLEGERDRYKLADLADPRIKANKSGNREELGGQLAAGFVIRAPAAARSVSRLSTAHPGM